MNKQEFYNWLVENKDKKAIFSFNSLNDGVRFINTINGYDVKSLENNVLNIIFINNSGSVALALSDDCIIDEVDGGYRVTSKKIMYSMQIL